MANFIGGVCSGRAPRRRVPTWVRRGGPAIKHVAAEVSPMKRCHTKGRENFRELYVLPPLLGERAGVRASIASNLILGVVGSNSPGKGSSFRADSRRLLLLLRVVSAG